MNFLDRFLARRGYLSKKQFADYIATAGPVSNLNSLLFGGNGSVDKKAAMEAYRGWVFACARVIGEEIAKTKFKLFKVGNKGDQEELYDHELLDLLNKPNPFQIGWEFKFLMGVYLELVGRFYMYLGGVSSENEKPLGLYPLMPQNITVKKGKVIEELIAGYEYSVNGKKAFYTPAQVVCIRYPNPNEHFDGMGVVEGIANWIDQDNYATEFNTNFFRNGARIGGYLETENYQSPEMLEYMTRAFEEAYAGAKNAYKTVAMPEGTKYTPSQQSQKEMDFVEGQRDTRDKILSGFRVPKTALGITEDVNRANAEATDYVFATRTIKPKLQLICEFLNVYLVPRFGENLVLGFEDPTPENREMEINEMNAAVAGQPILSVDEARERYFGYGKVKNGDQVMTDFTKTPLGGPINEMKNAKPVKKSNVVGNQKIKSEKPASKIAQSLAIEAAKIVAKTKEESVIKFAPNMTVEQKEIVWKAFVGRVTPYERKLSNSIKQVNKDQKEEVIKKLPGATKAIDPKKLFDRDKYVATLIDLTEPIITDLYEKEGNAANEFIGAAEFSITPELKKAINRAISLMSESYNDTTLALLEKELNDGIENGEGISELTDRVNRVYGFSDEYRAERTAKTEVFRTANDAAHEAWKQTGVVKSIKWYTARDEMVCEFCGPMDGTVISIEKSFFDEGDTVSGSDGGTLDLSYDSVNNPPLHPNCRCEIMPEEISIN